MHELSHNVQRFLPPTEAMEQLGEALVIRDTDNDGLFLTARDVEREELASEQTQQFIDAIYTRTYKEAFGYAAQQFDGHDERMVAVVTNPEATLDGANPEVVVMINPVIISRSETTKTNHVGCMSVAYEGKDVMAMTEFPDELVVEYWDREGHEQTLEASGRLADIVDHELDHLDGTIFVSKVIAGTMAVFDFSKGESEETLFKLWKADPQGFLIARPWRSLSHKRLKEMYPKHYNQLFPTDVPQAA